MSSDLLQVDQAWNSAVEQAQQAWYYAHVNPGSSAGITTQAGQNPFAGVGDALNALWNGMRNTGQQGFDAWESTEWRIWRNIAEVSLQNKPVAYALLEHSLQDNPPNLSFPMGHFIPNAIQNSPEFKAKVAEIVAQHAAEGPGTYTDVEGILFSSGDLQAGIQHAMLHYTLVLKPDGTYTLDATLKDTYDFAMSWGYYNNLSLNGVGLTVAANIAWADQHLQMIEVYDWTATLAPQTGTWP